MIFRLVVHFVLAILLFYAINWLGAHSTAFKYKRLSLLFEPDEAPAFNLLFRILTPVVFLLLLSAFFYAIKADRMNEGIYLVVIYSFVFRLLYNVLLGRARLLNWSLQTLYLFTTAGLAYVAQKYLISKKEYLFPDFATLGNQLWLLIIGFLYLLFNNIQLKSAKTQHRKDAYLHHRYTLYKKKYGHIISPIIHVPALEALVYSIMIYEAFNRPKIFRVIESVGFWFGRSKTLGIMQMTTNRYISDAQSVRLACEKILNDGVAVREDVLKEDFSQYKNMESYIDEIKEQHLLNGILKRYNGGSLYNSEVSNLFRQIKTKFYSQCQPLMTSLESSHLSGIQGAH